MINRYFSDIIIALRTSPLSTSVNIAGMSFGIAIFLIILSYTTAERDVNKSFPEYFNIYRIAKGDGEGHQGTPAILGEILRDNIPVIRSFARVADGGSGNSIVAAKNPIIIDRLIFADSALFRLFPLSFIYGESSKCLENRFDLVITKSLAKKLFKEENPVGKTAHLNNRFDVRITAVIEDPGNKTHISGDAFISFQSLPSFEDNQELFECLTCYNYQTYVLIDSNSDVQATNMSINNFIHDYGVKHSIPSMSADSYTLLNLSEVYFGEEDNPMFKKGNRLQMYILQLVALLVILAALINYSILATAKSSRMLNSMAIRKILGASRKSLITVLLSESIIISLVSILTGFLFAEILAPLIGDTINSEIYLANIKTTPHLLLITLCGSAMGLLSGIIPAIRVTDISISGYFHSIIKTGAIDPTRRHLLIVAQVTIAIILTISTLIMLKQLKFIERYDPGFDRGKLLFVYLNDDIADRKEAFRANLLSSQHIENVSYSYASYRTQDENWGVPFNNENIQLSIEVVDKDYLNTMGITLLEGRDFLGPQDHMKIIVNESACRNYFGPDPLGIKIEAFDQMEIIGVIKDFNYETFHKSVEPMALIYSENMAELCNIRFLVGQTGSALEHIEKVWKEFCPNYPFSYHFVDELYHEQYIKEIGVSKLMGFFSIAAILITCLGVYAIARYTIIRKSKEIGIRKVFGSTGARVALLLSGQMTRIMLWTILPATLIALLSMNRWLSNFALRITISPLEFIAGILIIWCFIILSMSGQIVRATRINPVDTLKTT
jgi:putative ABC transport system permease protein